VKFIDDFPHRVQETRHVEIAMPDGVKLSARLWLPESAATKPVPAILEYIPYRKNDHTAYRDSMMHRYFAGHGYACVRVDLRGSGDSEGLLADEYLQRELDDGVAVLRWIASRPWCSGKIGMIGISWGGFNGLQIAAMQPAELKAVVSVCSTDDRYADDVHYMGGCLLGDNISWASKMFAYNALPPDPQQVGDRWRDMWLERLDANRPWLATWLKHQTRDGYWRHGSICENWRAITCPVMAVSGWADGYSNAVFRLIENLKAPRLGLIGPWSHKYPHTGLPGPAIGFLQECLRWWDHWLKDRDTGIMDEPRLRAWMQDSVPPTTYYDSRPGRWVGEAAWPSNRIEERAFVFASGSRLHPETETAGAPEICGDRTIATVNSPLSTGLFAGKWCSYAATPDLPHDQRREDGGALVFETETLSEDLEILGAPIVELTFETDAPIALVAVRISDIRPDDKATRVSYGVCNLNHRNGHADWGPLPLHTRRRATVQLNHVAQVFPKGHRIRIAISTSYWPLAWPAPTAVRLKLITDCCRLRLPVRPPLREDSRIGFQAPEAARPIRVEQLAVTEHNWNVIFDLAMDRHTLHVVDDNGIEWISDADIQYHDRTEEWYSSLSDDHESITAEVRSVRALQRGDWRPRVHLKSRLTASQTSFHLVAELDAFEGDQRIFSRNWDETIARNGV